MAYKVSTASKLFWMGKYYYSGETLPDNFIPHKTWIDQKIITLVQDTTIKGRVK